MVELIKKTSFILCITLFFIVGTIEAKNNNSVTIQDLNTRLIHVENEQKEEITKLKDELKKWNKIAEASNKTVNINSTVANTMSVISYLIGTITVLATLVALWHSKVLRNFELINKKFNNWRQLQILLNEIQRQIVDGYIRSDDKDDKFIKNAPGHAFLFASDVVHNLDMFRSNDDDWQIITSGDKLLNHLKLNIVPNDKIREYLVRLISSKLISKRTRKTIVELLNRIS